MNGKKRFLAAFILSTGFITVLFAAVLCTACHLTIGSLLPDPGLGVAENVLKAEDYKDLYYVGDIFKPGDFKLFVIIGGARIRVEDIIENDAVVITVIGDPSAGDTHAISKEEKLLGYAFKSATPAKKTIVISLDGMKISYDVLVEEKTDGSGQGTIVITWRENP
jgi:hypothetical protein